MMRIINRVVSAKTGVLTLIGLCLLTSGLVLPGCGAAATSRQEESSQPFVQVLQPPRDVPSKDLLGGVEYQCLVSMDTGENTGPPPERLMVIDNQDDYQDIIARFVKVTRVPDVDFAQWLVVLAGGEEPDSGHLLSVKSVVQTGNMVTVALSMSQPYPQMGALDVIAQAYHFLLIERSSLQPNGELRFILLDSNGNQAGETIASA